MVWDHRLLVTSGLGCLPFGEGEHSAVVGVCILCSLHVAFGIRAIGKDGDSDFAIPVPVPAVECAMQFLKQVLLLFAQAYNEEQVERVWILTQPRLFDTVAEFGAIVEFHVELRRDILREDVNPLLRFVRDLALEPHAYTASIRVSFHDPSLRLGRYLLLS